MGKYKKTFLPVVLVAAFGLLMVNVFSGGVGGEAVAVATVVPGPTMTDAQLRSQAPGALANDVDMSHLSRFVKDIEAAKVLGKALFWDMAAGSDGQACASCHFHAGADNRVKNQLSPSILEVIDSTRADNPDNIYPRG